ncbi:WG repeat-containing protein [uncultured Microscilla sp.]|uniref:WG repeat-containing protein n=1 Tax=uncultured Microscilla sp. TaxID=432653 RepID=UPI00345465D0
MPFAQPPPPSCYAIATFYGKDGLINRQGEWVVEPMYDYLYFYSDKLLKAYAQTGGKQKTYLIDFKGKVIYSIPDTLSVSTMNHHRLLKARIVLPEFRFKEFGCINAKGKWVIAPPIRCYGRFFGGACGSQAPRQVGVCQCPRQRSDCP